MFFVCSCINLPDWCCTVSWNIHSELKRKLACYIINSTLSSGQAPRFIHPGEAAFSYLRLWPMFGLVATNTWHWIRSTSLRFWNAFDLKIVSSRWSIVYFAGLFTFRHGRFYRILGQNVALLLQPSSLFESSLFNIYIKRFITQLMMP